MEGSNIRVINEFYGAANFHIVGNKGKGVIGGLMWGFDGLRELKVVWKNKSFYLGLK